ncbi:tRNA 4-thiouridine(8) synthase ThiI [Thioalkalivibrio denitrificans]|uniref:tRNA sulfurtransferase n=1 Tax=Thioalkalivibrio denitrificans TaxID=108003 RepID=A0A1V3NCW5_9GAMM|nr:tRNA uracil 4-sulfurtransferase ThiI [Thioalkalivibrio denitrificans]OOG22702.1 tRNA 4-thiouridine(8) synthase ThiI [Thioalkalivibrio denitrificans]
MSERTHQIIIRQSPEVHLKSFQTRRGFRRKLRRNLRAALANVEHRLQVVQGGFMLETPEPETACEILPRVFGIASFSPVEAVTDADIDALCRVAREHITQYVRGRTFAVRCKRHGPRVLSTREVEWRVGAVLDGPGKVDLSHPQVTVRVDLWGDHASFHVRRIPGAGGLPVGVQGRALALISGGFDSAVAAWYTMRRGAMVDYVFCNLGGAAHLHQVTQVARLLAERWASGTRPRLFVVDFQAVVSDLRVTLPSDVWQVVLKRLMYRAADAIARRIDAEALVTGEALSQVSSQTLSNLNTIDAATDLPVLRPLIGFDKQEIMERARDIGTFVLSEKAPEFCALTNDRPLVRTRREQVDAQEALLEAHFLEEAIENTVELDLLALTAEDLAEPGILVEEIPDDVEVIDCQPPQRYRHWHVPGAVNRTPDQLTRQYRELPRDRRYLLYCLRGTHSAILAERMRDAGFDACAFRGDVGKVKKAWLRKLEEARSATAG